MPLLKHVPAPAHHRPVLNEKLQPIAGATVLLKRTGATIITTADGRFSFPSSGPADTLVVSAVGYTTAYIRNNERGKHTIILKTKDTELETVVINTGYQRLPKERITGSFAVVDKKQLNLQAGINILDRLKGIAAAVNFDANINRTPITIRGLSTINGAKAPLVVLDNFPYDGPVENINPDDVESITILKDAAAASIWGTRAGNGVIVITTRRGRLNQKLTIDFNSGFIMQRPPDLFYTKPMSSRDFVELEEFLFSKGYFKNLEASAARPALTPALEILIQQRDGRLGASEAAEQLNRLKQHDVRNDYAKHFYRDALTYQNSISVRGGSTAMAWNLSAGMDRNTGNLASRYDRFTLRAQNTVEVMRNLVFNAGLSYTSSIAHSGKQGFNTIFLNSTRRLYPYASLVDDAGEALPVYTYRQPFIDTVGGGSLLDWKLYPATDYRYNRSLTRLNSVIGDIGLSYQLLQGLSIDAKYRYEKQITGDDNIRTNQSYSARDLINRFSQLNRNTGVISYIIPNASILDRSTDDAEAQNFRIHLNFSRQWQRHQLTAIAGNELRWRVTKGDGFRVYGFDENTLTSSNMDFLNSYATFITGSRQVVPNNVGLSEKEYRFVSLYANAAYTYNEKYTLSASARRDASNLFGLNTNDKWTPLWSVGAGWNLAKERFYSISQLPLLRLRLTYGLSGNVDLSKSAATTVRYGNAPLTNFPSATFSQYGNPDLRWEKSAMLNFGIDFSTNTNVLSGSIEYYRKKGTDLFGPAPLDYTAGLLAKTITKNVAAMKASGMDIVLNSVNVNRRIKWTTGAIINYNHNEITDYYLSTLAANNFIGSGSAISALPGSPVYALMVNKWGGLDASGNPQGFLDNALTTDYNRLVGSDYLVTDLADPRPALPTWTGSVNNTISWKGWSLSALVSFSAGNYLLRESVQYAQLFSQYLTHADYARRWQKPGDEAITNVPSLVYPANSNRDIFYAVSEALVEKADYVKLQNLHLGFRPQASGWMRNISFYAVATNLGILWRANKHGIDPEYGNAIPPGPSFALGFKSSF
ncbi:MAG: SusC/RagA family TonB-linked outer membrane protein [Flavisolibacter sp.]